MKLSRAVVTLSSRELAVAAERVEVDGRAAGVEDGGRGDRVQLRGGGSDAGVGRAEVVARETDEVVAGASKSVIVSRPEVSARDEQEGVAPELPDQRVVTAARR